MEKLYAIMYVANTFLIRKKPEKCKTGYEGNRRSNIRYKLAGEILNNKKRQHWVELQNCIIAGADVIPLQLVT